MSPAPSVVAVVAWSGGMTNAPLVEAWRELGLQAELLAPPEARRELGPGDVAVVRLDVLETVDGIEDGLDDVAALERRGVRVVNRPRPLVAVHDKLRTMRLLRAAGVRHPPAVRLREVAELRRHELPFVVKPRLGSWGRDVHLCESPEGRERCIAVIRDRSWFRRQGAFVQQLVPPQLHDLRLVVAGGRVVGAGERRAAPGEWRTNVSLGGSCAPALPGAEARALGLAAAKAIGIDLVGVDLLPAQDGPVVLELNGAVDFDRVYSFPGRDVFVDAAVALDLLSAEEAEAADCAPGYASGRHAARALGRRSGG
jgi:RimK family alpha-L-glutamate ligase